MAHQFHVSCTIPSRDIDDFAFVFDFRTINNFIADSSDEYDKGIKANADEAVSLAVADLKERNSRAGLAGSTFNDLVIFLKSFLGPQLIGVSSVLPFLKDTIVGALKGGSKSLKHGNLVKGVFGTVGGLAKGATTGFQKIGAKIGTFIFTGERNRMNIF